MISKQPTWLRNVPHTYPGFSRMLIILHIIVLASIVAIIFITNSLTAVAFTLHILSAMGSLVMISLVLTLYGYFAFGRVILPLGLILTVTVLVLNGQGIHDTAMLAFSTALLLGGMLVGRHGLWAFTLVCMSAILLIGLSEMYGIIVTPFTDITGWDDILINYTMLIAISTALNVVMKRMEQSIEAAQKNEQAWKVSEERFRVFMETSPAIVIMKDADGRYVYCNPKVESLFGRTAGDIIGKTEYDLFPREEAEQFTESDRLVLSTGQAITLEYAARVPSGKERYWWVFKFPMRDSSGRQYVGMQILDITERKDVEAALARERDLLHALMDSIPDTVYFKDRESHFTRINHHQARMLRVESVEDAIGKSDIDFLPASLAASVFEEEQALLKDGNSIRDHVEYIPLPDGTPRWLSASKAPLHDKHGNIIGLVGISRDITERKLAEIEREKLINDLEARNAELERFTYTVSHDLKAPIVTIQGFLGFLERDAIHGDIERIKHDSQRIKAATDKMHKLLNELLELSRIGRLMNPPQQVPFASIVQDALAIVDGQLRNRNITVSVPLDLPEIYGDKARLVEVMQNLLDNACKYMGDQAQPHIEVGCQVSADGRKNFFVRDNGMGIDPTYHQRVFGLFDKLDPRTEGTGVGLALVKRIVEVHGGSIWIESQGPGHGSCFYFTLAEKP